MAKSETIVWSVFAALSLSSCSMLDGQRSWKVQPDMSVTHSGSKAEGLYRMGRYHQDKFKYDEAIAAYRRALEIDTRYIAARNGLGVSYSAQGRYNDAIIEFKAAVALAPQLAYLHNNLGYAY